MFEAHATRLRHAWLKFQFEWFLLRFCLGLDAIPLNHPA